jgi:hypothetical protein
MLGMSVMYSEYFMQACLSFYQVADFQDDVKVY